MKWDLSQFDGKDVIMTGDNRDMLATRKFLERHSRAKSFRHVFVNVSDTTPAYEQLGSPDMSQTIIIKSPGVPGRQMKVPFITTVQLFFDATNQLGAKVIGVTGTKGKTTTASLIHSMLLAGDKPSILCGNIGNSFLPFLDSATRETIFVAELSSQMLEDLTVSPHIAVITNLYNDHTDYHGSLVNYYSAKKHLVAYLRANDVFIYNSRIETLEQWAKELNCRTVPISGNEQMDMSKTHLIGEHNRLNAIIARAAAMECGVSTAVCQQALDAFEPLPHRLQPVATIHDITYIDDAIASQPEAAMAGIKAVTGQIGPIGCLLLGGQDRDYDFTGLMQMVASAHVPSLVLFPDSAQKMKAAMPSDYQPELFETKDMTEAVKWASQRAPAKSVVLLCTGAPSYSIWKDFEDKGDQFQAAVKNL